MVFWNLFKNENPVWFWNENDDQILLDCNNIKRRSRFCSNCKKQNIHTKQKALATGTIVLWEI